MSFSKTIKWCYRGWCSSEKPLEVAEPRTREEYIQIGTILKNNEVSGNDMCQFVEMTIQLPEKCFLNSGQAVTPLVHYWSGQP